MTKKYKMKKDFEPPYDGFFTSSVASARKYGVRRDGAGKRRTGARAFDPRQKSEYPKQKTRKGSLNKRGSCFSRPLNSTPNNKVSVHPFQRVADSKGGAFGRSPQRAKHPFLRSQCAGWVNCTKCKRETLAGGFPFFRH